MATYKHLVDESSVTIGPDGIEATDVYIVSGVTGPASIRPYLATQRPGIPQYGDKHPIKGLSIDSVTCRPEVDSPNTFRIITIARRPVIDSGSTGDEDEIDDADLGTLAFFYVQRDVQTQFDAQGSQITVTHTYAADDEHGRGGLIVTQGGEVTIQTWQQGIRYTRRESTAPASLQADYAGRLNEREWNGYPAKSILCVGIDGDTADGGASWSVNYVFMIDTFRNFKADVLFSDPMDGGKPPKGLKADKGYKSVDVYPVIDFNPLKIDFTNLRRSASSEARGKAPIGYRRQL